jgi:hypothetical protein
LVLPFRKQREWRLPGLEPDRKPPGHPNPPEAFISSSGKCFGTAPLRADSSLKQFYDYNDQ